MKYLIMNTVIKDIIENPTFIELYKSLPKERRKIYREAFSTLPSLGSGNHFCEFQKGSDGYVWIMIHSGSRNLGKQVCDYYKQLAFDLNHKWHAKVPEDNLNNYLGFLPVDSIEGQQYLNEMQFCVDFAFVNRKLMMDRILDIIKDTYKQTMRVDFASMINIAHNYASLENHFGKNVWVHRKGATLAREGTIGIIPGSMGSKSYIVKGKGNKDSFESCSHGAGRTMGRNVAKKSLNLADEIKLLNDQGIVHGIRSEGDLDEATHAYKDIAEVMKQQEDLVEILVELTPLAVIK